jgi:hypothetical protein
MLVKDVEGCVQLLASHPVERHRHGSLLARLSSVWKNLLRSESIITSVLEDAETPGRHPQAFGVSAFVADDFLQQCKIPNPVWIGRELVHRISRGDSPVFRRTSFVCQSFNNPNCDSSSRTF